MSKDDVASALAVELETEALEGADHLCAGHRGQLAQTAISTTSSSIVGGIGSS